MPTFCGANLDPNPQVRVSASLDVSSLLPLLAAHAIEAAEEDSRLAVVSD